MAEFCFFFFLNPFIISLPPRFILWPCGGTTRTTSDMRGFIIKTAFYWMSQKLSYTHHVGKTALIHSLCWPPLQVIKCLFQSTNIIGIRHTPCVFSIAADWSIIYSQFDSIVHQLRIIPQSYFRISHNLLSIHDILV